jgi:hypothetical protein
MRIGSAAVTGVCILVVACGQAQAPKSASTPAPQPRSHHLLRVGDCVDATVASVGSRLEGVANSGSAILYTNGLSQVSYDAVAGIDHAKAGDSVRLCLASAPQNCPPGDERGKVYSATNQRTGETWSAPDSEHACGGA